MRVSEAIAKADELRLNSLGDEIKARWLCDLDGQLMEMMWTDISFIPPGGRNKENCPTASDKEAPQIWPAKNTWPGEDTELLMPAPHEMVYVYYLAAQIDYYQQESELYVNDMAVYNAAMSDARAWWRRNHRPRDHGNWRVM